MDPTELWEGFEHQLRPELKQFLVNIERLKFSKEDADLDNRIREDTNDNDEDSVDMSGLNRANLNFDIDHLVDNREGLALAASAMGLMIERARDIDVLNLQKPNSAAAQTLADFHSLLDDPVNFVAENRLNSEPLLDGEDFGFHSSVNDFSAERVKAIISYQKSENQRIARSLASRELQDMNRSDQDIDNQGGSSGITGFFGPDQGTEVTMGRSTSYCEVGRTSAELWTLNRQQALALHMPLQFLDRPDSETTALAQKQLRLYIGGEGGTGKTQVLHALRDVFQMKGEEYAIEMTASSAIAASKISGRTIHSAVGIHPDQSWQKGRNRGSGPSGEDIARWKHKLVLVVDEISMLGAATLAEVDDQLQKLRSSNEAFGGIPVIIFSGDFFQFPPVKDRSVLLQPLPPSGNKDMQDIIRQTRGFHLFNDCHKVVILKQQVRASSCPQLRGILDRFRKGEQTIADHEQLCTRAHRGVPWVLGSSDGKILTPINQHRWDLNLASALEWGRSKNRHISLFLSSHEWVDGTDTVSDREIQDAFLLGDSSHVKIPGLLPFGRGMPMMLTQNTQSYLKLVNGAEVEAVCAVPDPKFPGYFISPGVTLYFGPPRALIIRSSAFDHLEISGLPPGMIAITPSTVQLSPKLKPGSKKVIRRGCMITPAFAVTDMRGQGLTVAKVLAQLRGRQRRQDSEWQKCDFTSSYVQLSRATSWDGIWLASEPRLEDFLENRIPEDLAAGVHNLEVRSEQTISAFIRCNQTQEEQRWISWWQSIPETTQEQHTTQSDQSQDYVLDLNTDGCQLDVDEPSSCENPHSQPLEHNNTTSDPTRWLHAQNGDQGSEQGLKGSRVLWAERSHLQRFHIEQVAQHTRGDQARGRRIRKHLWRTAHSL